MQQFVYSFYLVAVLMIVSTLSLSAQCTPLDSIPGGAIIDPLPYTEDMPGNGLRDTACVGLDFETVINFAIPDTIALGALGLLPIDSVAIIGDGVTGVPSSFNFDCNPDNCTYYPNELGCLRIFGLPTAEESGMYNLEVNVRIFSGLFSFDRTLPDPTIAPGEYRLFVRESDNPACAPSAIVEGENSQFTLAVYPNPAANTTNVQVSSAVGMEAQLQIINAQGQLVSRQTVSLLGGTNNLTLATDTYTPGIYHVVITNGREGVSTRLLIIR